MDFARGRIIGIVGESGSGKSTLVSCLLRLLPNNLDRIEGEILFEGTDLLKLPPAEMNDWRGRKIAMIFQDPMTALNPLFTVGTHLRDILRRLWPLMIGTVVGCWLNAGALTGPHARYGTIVLGALLVIYAVIGLNKFQFHVAPRNEKWIGGVVGVVTGVISASTGVQVIPSMPFMQAIGMEKDELVQALGVFFTTATLALAF
ncbi:ATP-binding cassette domain-containing protein, partial [Herbaspirillum sp. HC18]